MRTKTYTHNSFIQTVEQLEQNTEYSAELATGIGLSVPFTGLAVSEVLSRVQQHMKANSLQTIFVLDEIDHLVKSFGDYLLYDLTNSSTSTTPGFLSLVGISNDLQFKEELGARVLSRLSEEEIVFPPYSAIELKTILQERAKFAFNIGMFTEGCSQSLRCTIRIRTR